MKTFAGAFRFPGKQSRSGAMHRIVVSIVGPSGHPTQGSDMGIFFDRERRLIATIAVEKDVAASTIDPSRRRDRFRHVGHLAQQLPHTRMERLLLRGF